MCKHCCRFILFFGFLIFALAGSLTVNAKVKHSNAIVAPKYSSSNVLYGLKTLYMYDSPTFTKDHRLFKYSQKHRLNRPLFYVNGYVLVNGKLRYKVRDINHKSASNYTYGYITALPEYTTSAYYQTKHTKITVINPQGVNAYKSYMAYKQKKYRQGSVLSVVGISKSLGVPSNTFKLSNGNYVTTNKKYVIAGKYRIPKYVELKKTIHLYKTVNLTNSKATLKKGSKLKVYRTYFSHPNKINMGDTKRYKIYSGYITANKAYVNPIY